MSQTFRKRPAEVEAMQFLDTESGMRIIDWVKGWGVRVTGSQGLDVNGQVVPILLLEVDGAMRQVRMGYWVVREGTTYTFCDPLEFEATYEATAEVPQ